MMFQYCPERLMCNVLVILTAVFLLGNLSSAEDCSLPGHDIKNLTNVPWHVEAKQVPDLDLYFKFCYNGTQGKTFDNLCNKTNACTKGKNESYFAVKPILAPHDGGFEIVYKGATQELHLHFHCDNNAFISSGANSEMGLITATNLTTNSSMIVAFIPFAGACSSAPTTTPPPPSSSTTSLPPTSTPHPTPSPTPKPHDEGLSTGSTLIIIALSFILLYLSFGVFYNHSHGAQGVEMIPNYEFWSDLPNLVIDGCIYTVKVVTCSTTQSFPGGAMGAGGGTATARNYESL